MLKGISRSRGVYASINASTYIQLQSETRFIQVYAISKDVYLRWAEDGEDYVTAENFDEVIPAGQVMTFAVADKNDSTPFDAIQIIGRESGATAILIEK